MGYNNIEIRGESKKAILKMLEVAPMTTLDIVANLCARNNWRRETNLKLVQELVAEHRIESFEGNCNLPKRRF